MGISHKLNRRIKPSKHPNMRKLELALKLHGLRYIYFDETDSLAITEVNYHPYMNLCNTLMMPTYSGISVLMVVNNEVEMDELVCGMGDALDEIMPEDIDYSIVGVL